jgi:hypothetical protein
VIDGDVHALVAEVVGDGQALDAPTAGWAVADEVHAPDFVDGLAFVQWHAFELQALLAAALAHRQVSQLVEPVHALVVDLGARSAQQVADAPVAEAPPFLRQLNDALARRLVVRLRRLVRSGPDSYRTHRCTRSQAPAVATMPRSVRVPP